MRNHTFIATVALAAVVAAAPLASAQNRNHRPSSQGGEQRGGGGGGGQGGGQRAERQAQPRDGGRVQQAPRENGRREAREAAPQGRREVAPQQERREREPQTFAQRNDGNRRDDRRADGRRDGRNDGRPGIERRAVPRNGPVPRYRDGDRRVYVQPRNNYYVYRYPAYRYYGGTRYYGYRYYDPYFAGDFYWSNHAWRSRTYYVGSNYDYDLGKLRLDIDQRDAEVYIDGYYAGVVDDFDGVLQGLRLEAGNYQVEIALPGFEPLQFDVHVSPGRTTTYRGSLLPE